MFHFLHLFVLFVVIAMRNMMICFLDPKSLPRFCCSYNLILKFGARACVLFFEALGFSSSSAIFLLFLGVDGSGDGGCHVDLADPGVIP